MSCVEKQRLLADYKLATEAFAAAVDQLHHLRATSSRDTYEALRLASEEHRISSERARLALETHIASHGC